MNDLEHTQAILSKLRVDTIAEKLIEANEGKMRETMVDAIMIVQAIYVQISDDDKKLFKGSVLQGLGEILVDV